MPKSKMESARQRCRLRELPDLQDQPCVCRKAYVDAWLDGRLSARINLDIRDHVDG